jgi:NADPH2:quinone reductase
MTSLRLIRDAAAVGSGQKVLVIDATATASFRAAEPYLTRRGMYLSSNPTADVAGFAWAALSSRRAGYLMMLKTNPKALARLVELTEARALRPVIDSVFDLADADAAFDRFATRGKQGRMLPRSVEPTVRAGRWNGEQA